LSFNTFCRSGVTCNAPLTAGFLGALSRFGSGAHRATGGGDGATGGGVTGGGGGVTGDGNGKGDSDGTAR
jgi:hypothetical protein